MNFFLANCLQEDNKRAGKKAIYAETGQNTDELQTNKKTRWRHQKKQSSADSAGQQH
jgi:protein involved in temperature-dependent protein secretion